MRLWHKDLIGVLPTYLLEYQYSDMSKLIERLMKPKNRQCKDTKMVSKFDKSNILRYTIEVRKELQNRGMETSQTIMDKVVKYSGRRPVQMDSVFPSWHNDRYLRQCYYALEEEYDKGVMKEIEYNRVFDKVCELGVRI